MAGGIRQKIQALLIVAMLAVAEAQQVRQGVRSSTAHGVNPSARRALDGEDAVDAVGGRELAAKNFQQGLADHTVSNLLDRSLKGNRLHRVDLDHMTLGKTWKKSVKYEDFLREKQTARTPVVRRSSFELLNEGKEAFLRPSVEMQREMQADAKAKEEAKG